MEQAKKQTQPSSDNNKLQKTAELQLSQHKTDNGQAIKQVAQAEQQRSILNAYQQDPPTDAIRKPPQLAGSYAAIQAIDKKAEADGLSPEQRAIVSDRVSYHIEKNIEAGQYPEMRIRLESELKEEVRKEREYTR